MTENNQDHDPGAIDTDEPTLDGIAFNRVQGDIPPPATRRKHEDTISEDTTEDQKIDQERTREFVEGRIPLHPAVIRLPASVFGRLASEITGYEGFTFTQEELDDLASLWMACGIEANPRLQAMVGSIAMLGVKAGGYTVWRRQGSSGDIRNARRRGFQE